MMFNMTDFSLSELRQRAKLQGLRGYSKLPKAKLLWLLEAVVVWKGDRKAVHFLKSDFLRTCNVYE